MREAIERKDSYLRMMESVPTQVYLSAALGATAGSALLRLFGKKDAAIFVGQWPPTLVLLALAHKLLRPSAEPGFRESREAAGEAARVVQGPGADF